MVHIHLLNGVSLYTMPDGIHEPCMLLFLTFSFLNGEWHWNCHALLCQMHGRKPGFQTKCSKEEIYKKLLDAISEVNCSGAMKCFSMH